MSCWQAGEKLFQFFPNVLFSEIIFLYSSPYPLLQKKKAQKNQNWQNLYNLSSPSSYSFKA